MRLVAKYGLLFLCFAPVYASAAGFASQAIFVSKSPVIEGDSVHIYAVVSNPGTDTFKGSVVISEGGNTIGTVPLTLTTGGAQTVSVVWRPAAGTHTIKASLVQGGTTAAETEQSFVVQEKPKPKPVATANTTTNDQIASAVESSTGIQQSIESISPAAGNVAKPVFGTLDSVRQSIANVADQQLVNIKPKVAPLGGKVEGTSTEASSQPWYFAILYTIYFYILTLVRFIVGSAGVFYPVVAILFLYFLYRMFRRYRRG